MTIPIKLYSPQKEGILLRSGRFLSRTFLLKKEQKKKEDNLTYKFLENYDSAMEWARENINDLPELFYEIDLDEDEYHRAEIEELHHTYNLVNQYVFKYNSIIDKKSVKIYRELLAEKEEDIDFTNIGKHWSFDINGVGIYGAIKTEKDKSFILTGKINPKGIDWVYGFTSFMWYGENQWECALKKGSKVEIIKINEKVLTKPIIAINKE